MSRQPSKYGRCTHEPVMNMRDRASTTLTAGAIAFSYFDATARANGGWHCAKCKRYLKAKWYPVEER